MMDIYKKYKFKKGNFLKYVEQVYKVVLLENKMSEKYDLETIAKIMEQKDLITEIGEFTRSFGWLSHERTKERARVFTKSRFDYAIMCKELNISYDVAKSSISYINSELKKNIGENTLELLLDGKVEEAKLIFYFCSGKSKVSDYILDSAVQGLPDANFMTINLSECGNELKYLQLYSRVMFNKWLKVIDKDKMAYIRYILETDNPKFAEKKKELVKLLRGEKKVSQYLEELKERELF